MSDAVRTFATGATRHNDADKYDYEGFLHPTVLEAYAAYMHVNRKTLDGKGRDSDNWQKGIPPDAYMKSGWRHFLEWWKIHDGITSEEGELAATMGVVFNVMGWAFERMKADPQWFSRELAKYQAYRDKELRERAMISKPEPQPDPFFHAHPADCLCGCNGARRFITLPEEPQANCDFIGPRAEVVDTSTYGPDVV